MVQAPADGFALTGTFPFSASVNWWSQVIPTPSLSQADAVFSLAFFRSFLCLYFFPLFPLIAGEVVSTQPSGENESELVRAPG